MAELNIMAKQQLYLIWSKFHCLIPEAIVTATHPFFGMEKIPQPDSRSYSYGNIFTLWYGAKFHCLILEAIVTATYLLSGMEQNSTA
jgi:hypothetical protein